MIVLSSHTDQELVLEALRLDASDYLAKPLHDEELVLAVRRALAGFDVESSWQRLRERLRRLETQMLALAARLEEAEDEPSQADLEAFAALSAEAVADVLDAGKTSLMLFDEEANELRVAAATGASLAASEMDPVALGQGVIMGGGLGIFSAAEYRLVTEKVRIALGFPPTQKKLVKKSYKPKGQAAKRILADSPYYEEEE